MKLYGVKSFLVGILLVGCTVKTEQTPTSFTITDANVNAVMPEYFKSFRDAVINKTPIPKLEGGYFSSGGVTNVFSPEDKSAAENAGANNVVVFDPKVSGGGAQGAVRGVISFTQDINKCCFFCGQFGGGICSSCKASECQFGPGGSWICGEIPNSCNPNLCVAAQLQGLLTPCPL